jgi:hypothetical protein
MFLRHESGVGTPSTLWRRLPGGGTAQQTPVSESGGDASAWLEALRRKMADELTESSKRMVEKE